MYVTRDIASGRAAETASCRRLHIVLWIVLWVLLLTMGTGCTTARPTGDEQPHGHLHERSDERPNVLLVLADDLGYSDLGSYGGEIRTPNLDRLADGGLRFTQFYNSSRCCPSRASLLTGVYPHQAGIGRFVGSGTLPGYLGRLNDRIVTIAEVLQDAGYGTYMVGKWHVNEPGPTERGFDEFYGFVHGYAVDSWDPSMMVRLPEGRTQRTYAPGEYFATDALTDHALDFLDIARAKDEPWFLYVAYQAPHFPVQAPPALTATYVETYRQGWDVLRAQRMARLRKLGLMDDDVPLSPRGPVDLVSVAERHGSMTEDGDNPPWASLDAARQADLAQRMAVYAAMVENMDKNVGRLVERLRERGELDDTVILFVSDNGACAEWDPWGFDLDPADYRDHEPGHGINGSTPGKPNVLHTGAELAAMGGPGSFFSYGSAWANLSNTPLRLYKHYAHEGGIRTPFIAHWPAGIDDRGALREQPGHLIDIMTTVLELAGAEYPERYDGAEVIPMEGRSLLPAFAGEPVAGRTLVFEHEHNAALREGDWKLVAENVLAQEGLREGVRWELYNIREDPTEQNDLAAERPELVERLSQRFLEEAWRTQILPAR